MSEIKIGLDTKLSRREFVGGALAALGVAVLTALGVKQSMEQSGKEPKAWEIERFNFKGKVKIPPEAILRSSPFVEDQAALQNILFWPGKHEEITLENPKLVIGGGWIAKPPTSESDKDKDRYWAKFLYEGKIVYAHFSNLIPEGEYSIEAIPTPTR
jgi:hypothetical protein